MQYLSSSPSASKTHTIKSHSPTHSVYEGKLHCKMYSSQLCSLDHVMSPSYHILRICICFVSVAHWKEEELSNTQSKDGRTAAGGLAMVCVFSCCCLVISKCLYAYVSLGHLKMCTLTVLQVWGGAAICIGNETPAATAAALPGTRQLVTRMQAIICAPHT